MKTVITKNIDGFNIIVGLGQAQIDPIATEKNIKPLYDKSQEKKDTETLKNQMQVIIKARNEAIKLYKDAKNKNDTKKMAIAEADYKLRYDQLEEMKKDMIEKIKLIKAKEKELWNNNLIYFEPKANEKIVDDIQSNKIESKLIEIKDKNVLLAEDLSEIVDNRNVQYVKNGKIITIKKLGELPDGPLVSELSDEQIETMRIEAMTKAERTEELQKIDSALVSRAAMLRSELEIKGDLEALKKSQDWYNAEKLIYEKKYLIS